MGTCVPLSCFQNSPGGSVPWLKVSRGKSWVWSLPVLHKPQVTQRGHCQALSPQGCLSWHSVQSTGSHTSPTPPEKFPWAGRLQWGRADSESLSQGPTLPMERTLGVPVGTYTAPLPTTPGCSASNSPLGTLRHLIPFSQGSWRLETVWDLDA